MDRIALKVSLLAVGIFAAQVVAVAEDALAARSILSDTCFTCHGPDANTREADLRLDMQEGIASVIDADALSESELLRRITTDDPNDRMPPPETGLSLSDKDIAALTRWVKNGADLPRHWSFTPITDSSPSDEAMNDPWVQNSIDGFVLDRLREEGIEPAPRADKETLLRRVTLDLTGLPPTVEEMDAFLADDRPMAYAEVVEDLLARPSYGERMALDWLDVARYADTFGYQSDVDNEVWPWRDWVIQAFNENLPYDEFVRDQLAGDLLPNPHDDQILATAFNRLHRQTNEGGSINEEWRVEYVADRTQTFGTAFLGMTFECAKCHDHKYDPVSQKDFFSLFAFFDDIDESGLYSHFTNSTPTPALTLYRDSNAKMEHRELLAAIDSVEGRVETSERTARSRFKEWLEQGVDLPLPEPQAHYSFDDVDDRAKSAPDRKLDAKFTGAVANIEGVVGNALKFSGEDNLYSEEAGVFERIDPFAIACWIQPGQEMRHTVIYHRCVAESDAASRGYELMLENGKPTFSLIHFWPGDAIRVEADHIVPVGEWTHVAVTYDGSSRADGLRIFINGEQAELRVIRDKLTRLIRYTDTGSKPKFTLAERFRDNGFKNGAIDEVRIYDRELGAGDVKHIFDAERAAEPRVLTDDEQFERYLLHADEEHAVALQQLHEARLAEHNHIQAQRQIMVMREEPEPRQAYLLERGSYELRADPVEPETPEAILPFPEDSPRNRLGLAEWLVDERNPLTARVAVNRYWQLFFGQGLVRTQEDFGNQGSLPSHPKLLDHLATRFVDSGWDVKALCEYIVTSATYQQANRSDLNERDPENVLLAQGPRHRLNAEQVRDAALAASGLLVPTIGGPSTKPYQPEGLWSQASSKTYKQDEGDGLYRKSMYTFIKRTVPPPSMVTFDAPGREVCRARRERTATPLQALVLLNDPQFVEAARVLAESTLKDLGSGDDAIEHIFRALTSRTPTDRESGILKAIVREQRELFAADSKAANQYLSVGEAPRIDGIDAVDAAAYTALAQAIMNFDAFQVKP